MIFELSGSQLRVMGTLHLVPAGRALPSWVRSGYEWSDVVFVEHSPSEFLQLAQQPDTAASTPWTPQFRRLLEKAAGTGSPIALEGLQRGASVVMALSSRMARIAAPGADQALHDWCQADRKPFGYLEQAAQALAVLNAIEETEWTPAIEAELARPQTPGEQMQRFYDLWRKGRLTDIEGLSREGLFSVPGIRRRMLTARNEAWAAPYADPPKRSLVAVGAAHLVGPGNFLEALARASGRAVRRIV